MHLHAIAIHIGESLSLEIQQLWQEARFGPWDLDETVAHILAMTGEERGQNTTHTILYALDAEIVVCPRRADDPPGDPCVHRFRDEVVAGAVPFSVQGTENAWCLDGGRTIA